MKNRVNRNTNIFSIKRVNRKVKEVSRLNNGKEMYKKNSCTCRVVFLLIRKKKRAACAKLFFFLRIRSIVVVFTVLVAFNLSLALLDFIFSLRNL